MKKQADTEIDVQPEAPEVPAFPPADEEWRFVHSHGRGVFWRNVGDGTIEAYTDHEEKKIVLPNWDRAQRYLENGGRLG